MKIKSTFAILDVLDGREELKKHFDESHHYPKKPETIPVVIYGEIDAIHGHDDGVSREFSVEVTAVHIDYSKG